MKRDTLIIYVIAILAVVLTSCANSKQQRADELLALASQQYERHDYRGALAIIDSLRHIYPNAIDTRKKALRLQQDIELHSAQEELAVVDSMLEAVKHNYDYQKTKVERDKANLSATPEELTMLTLTRMKRDSLQTRFEVLGAKIRYIRKKQKE